MLTKQPKNGTPNNLKERSTSPKWATGDSNEATYGRGVRRWRISLGLTVPVAAEKFGIPTTAWYAVESGLQANTTAGRIDAICRAIAPRETLNATRIKLLTLGEPEEIA